MSDQAPPRTGSDPEQLANFGFYSGIAGAILTVLTCVPIINFCTCFVAPLGAVAAIALSAIARGNLGPEAAGQPADRARYGLWLGIGSLVLYVLIFVVQMAVGLSFGFLDALQQDLTF